MKRDERNLLIFGGGALLLLFVMSRQAAASVVGTVVNQNGEVDYVRFEDLPRHRGPVDTFLRATIDRIGR